MSRLLSFLALAACAACVTPSARPDATDPTSSSRAAESATRPRHDRAFWKRIADDAWRVPADEKALDLALELASQLGHTDPTLRDEIPYAAMTHWLFPEPALTDAERRALVAQLEKQLDRGLGERDGEGVLLRSFSALHLSLLAKSDLDRPFLGDVEWHALFRHALAYLAAERDVRGWVAGTGWHHSVAHTADLLKFLARSPRLGAGDQERILRAIEEKCATVDAVFAWGEDERLAQCVVSLVGREQDFDAQVFNAWLARIEQLHARVWREQPFDARTFVAARNLGNVLRNLPAALAVRAEGKPVVARTAADVLTTLTRL